jgi:steroid 5-alpha reductase family enzyme
MSFFQTYLQALLIILTMMSFIWLISVLIKNVSIVDSFWGLGFVITCGFYFFKTGETDIRKMLLLTMVTIWGLRLSLYITLRNKGKEEDFRYKEFRKKYGESHYWWISFFQTFLLQGLLMWLISAPLLGAQYSSALKPLGFTDYLGIVFWLIGFSFEAGGDFQLSKFRSNPENKGKVLDTGFWRYTRHPNYFGDSAVWWGYGLICISAGSYIPAIGSFLMTALIIKVSGVALLEKTLVTQKPQYKEYIEKTSAFIPWFPKKNKVI